MKTLEFDDARTISLTLHCPFIEVASEKKAGNYLESIHFSGLRDLYGVFYT